MNQEAYFYLNILWTKWLAIGTLIMAGAILATALFAGYTLWKSNARQRYEFANQLFNQFQTFHLELWQAFSILSAKKYSTFEEIKKENPEIQREVKTFIIFLSRIGLLLRKKILNFNEIDFYFHQYFSDDEAMVNFIENASLVQNFIPGYICKNLDHLFTIIYNNYKIKDYNQILYRKFNSSIDLTKVEIYFWKRLLKKLRFWDKDYYREIGK